MDAEIAQKHTTAVILQGFNIVAWQTYTHRIASQNVN